MEHDIYITEKGVIGRLLPMLNHISHITIHTTENIFMSVSIKEQYAIMPFIAIHSIDEDEYEHIENEYTKSGLRSRMSLDEFASIFLALKSDSTVLTDYPFVKKYVVQMRGHHISFRQLQELYNQSRIGQDRKEKLQSFRQMKIMFNEN